MKSFWSKFLETFGGTGMVDRIVAWIPSLVSAIAIMTLFWAVWRGPRRGAEVVIRRAELDPTAANFIQTVLKYVLLTIGAVTALGKVGVKTVNQQGASHS